MTISRTGSKSQGAGFTLIEILIAVSILAIGTVGILRSYTMSVTAMERARRNIDAAYSLKTVMGDIEEKCITQGGAAAGSASGEISLSGEDDGDGGSYGKWRWNEEVRQIDFQAAASESGSSEDAQTEEASTEAASAVETSTEDETRSLSEVSLTVTDALRGSEKNVGLVTYVESKIAES